MNDTDKLYRAYIKRKIKEKFGVIIPIAAINLIIKLYIEKKNNDYDPDDDEYFTAG